MSSNSSSDNLCPAGDTICVIREYQKGVIVVPTLFIFMFVAIFLALVLLKYCPSCRHSSRTSRTHTAAPQSYHHRQSNYQRPSHRHAQTHRHNLQGIDAPPELNVLEHETLPMTVQATEQNARRNTAAATHMASEGQHRAIERVTPLPLAFSVKPDDIVTLHRARMDNRDVILRILKESADNSEKQYFLGFASFLSELGPHPFLPAMLGVVSLQPPLVIAMEELHHRDLLGLLWKCRQDNSDVDITEKQIFTLAGQVASALKYLHSRSCIHGNVGARSVLVGRDLSAKLWGLGPAYRRTSQAGSPGELEDMEMRKWQAPEVLSRRLLSASSDVWSFGILLYEIVTLGDPPFSQIMASELIQYLQRGNTLKRPATCSNAVYSIIKSCCRWNPQQRLSIEQLIRKLESGERGANDRIAIRVPTSLDIEKYLREAGYGENYNYAVL